MDQLHASRISAANATLVIGRQLDAVDEFFTAEYAGHGTPRDLIGPDAVRRFVAMLREADWRVHGIPTNPSQNVWRDMVTSRLQDGRIAEDWVVTDLAEHLLLARKGSG